MHPDQKTLDALNAPKAYQEYPKMLHHPDGSTVTVENATEEAALSDDYQSAPTDAAGLKAIRDEQAKRAQAAEIAAAKKAAAEAEAAEAKAAHEHEEAKKAAKK